MSTSCSDATGVAVFAGEPVVTPLVNLLLGFFEFRHDQSWKGDLPYSYYLHAEDGNPHWDSHDGDFEEFCEANGIELEEDWDLADVIRRILVHAGKIPEEEATALVESTDLDGSMDLGEIFAMLSAARDGNNLAAIAFKGGYWESRPRLFHQGGWAEYYDKKVSLAQGAYRVIDAGAKMIRGEHVEAYATMVKDLLDSIVDKDLRAEVNDRVAQLVASA